MALADYDPVTRDAIGRALWLRGEPAEGDLPAPIRQALDNHQGFPPAVAGRYRSRLDWLVAHPDSHTPDYRDLYTAFDQVAGDALPWRQAHALTSLMGKDSSRGYRLIPDQANLRFPEAFAVDLKGQMGWHFFVGMVTLEDGRTCSVELMLAQYALTPPDLLPRFGISDLDNTLVELHLSIAIEGERSWQAVPIDLPGTTGLVEYQADPFLARQGRNVMRSQRAGTFFPMEIQARGWDEGAGIEIGFDLTLTSGKAPMLQGDAGCAPCVGGVGTLYFSVPRITVAPGGTLYRGGEALTVRDGLLWFDHQWGTGMVPAGNPRSDALRAAGLAGPDNPMTAWDWFYTQLPGDIELTGACVHHGTGLAAFERQTGPEPPGTMTVPILGKLIQPDSSTIDVNGTMEVDRWEKSETSPDPATWRPTGTWHPAHWHYRWEAPVPEAFREYVVTPLVPGHFLRWAMGAEYREGLALAWDMQGNRIGQGFQECVAYGETHADQLRLAGLAESPALEKLLQRRAGFLAKSAAIASLLDPKTGAALKDDLGRARGL